MYAFWRSGFSPLPSSAAPERKVSNGFAESRRSRQKKSTTIISVTIAEGMSSRSRARFECTDHAAETASSQVQKRSEPSCPPQTAVSL